MTALLLTALGVLLAALGAALFALARVTSAPRRVRTSGVSTTLAALQEARWLARVNKVHEALGLTPLTLDGSPYVAPAPPARFAHPEALRFIPDETPEAREARYAAAQVPRVRRREAV